MKQTYYFRHDYNARNDHKISALLSDYGAAGYGVYWCLVEILHEEEGNRIRVKELFYRALSRQMNLDTETIKAIVKDCVEVYELFELQDEFLFSERVFRNIAFREDIREKRSVAGRISAENRKMQRERTKQLTRVEHVLNNDEQPLTRAEQNSTKERKGNKTKENPYGEFELWWDAYGKKVDRARTLKKWATLSKEDWQRINQVVAEYVASTPDAQFRKNPLTYLNGQCWLDEIQPAKMTGKDATPPTKPRTLNDRYNRNAALGEAGV